jgi:hypothetical protein
MRYMRDFVSGFGCAVARQRGWGRGRGVAFPRFA